ncbi:MAG: RHS repeat-associated core domain-containing protein [Opitutaceae bacterium]
MANSTSDVFTRSMTYDNLHRVDTLQLLDSSSAQLHLHDYQYDARGRRERLDREDGTYWDYSYNDRNEVVGGVKRAANGTALPGHSYGYTFDAIGNRESHSREGQTYDWTPNELNQVAEREMPDTVWLTGTAQIDATIFMNGKVAARNGSFWGGSATADNSSAPATLPLSIDSLYAPNGANGEVLQSSVSAGNAYFAQTPTVPVYDEDGNLEEDGRWIYKWNAENRLIEMETAPAAYTAGAPREKLEFVYDYQGRRVSKKVSVWHATSNAYLQTSSFLYLYDGWNLIAELKSLQTAPFTLHTSFLWGSDLSGSLLGAGGVGGLLAVAADTGSTVFPSYDGNGNVVAYYTADTTANVAEFEYDPFGELIRATGSKKDDFNFRFSTKYEDAETGLLYYGFRYYDASTGRWLSKDPIGERGGLNLYGMVGNDLLNQWDYLGLKSVKVSYDMADDGVGPFRAEEVDNWEQLLAEVKKTLEDEGEGCCLEELEISGHGGPGYFSRNFNDEHYDADLSSSTFKTYRNEQNRRKKGFPLSDSDYTKTQTRIIDILNELASYMCEGGTVQLVSCNSFRGDSGNDFKCDLEGIFGEGNVVGYENFISWGKFSGDDPKILTDEEALRKSEPLWYQVR